MTSVMTRSPDHQIAYQAEIRFADTTQWDPIGVQHSRLIAEAALRAVSGTWERICHEPLETRIVETTTPDLVQST
jgi:hypothetical protein